MAAPVLAKHPALWYQIASDLEREIADRAAAGELRLPTETALAKKYGVSLLTLRQAMGYLAKKGLIERKRKLGTFVRTDAIVDKEVLFLGSINAVVAQQRSDKVEVLERRIVETPATLVEPFGGERTVCRVVRLRYRHGRPTDLATNHIRRDVARTLDRRVLQRSSITQAIHERGLAKIGYIRQELEAGASREAAGKLGTDPLAALMILTGLTFNDADELIDHARILYRGDGVSFSLVYKA